MDQQKRTREQKKRDILAQIPTLTLMDDVFMRKFFEDELECTERILRVILKKPDLKVIRVTAQHTLKNLQGRSLQLDVDATDNRKRLYNVEMQNNSSGAKPKRPRYHSSLIDAIAILPGDDTEMLPETYVIFITKHDVLKRNLPIYHIERIIEETGEHFGDEEHIIYVNSSYQDDSPLGRLMHDFNCATPDEMYDPVLAERARYLKQDERGVKVMSETMERLMKDWIAEEREEARAEGKEEGRAEGKAEGKAEGREEILSRLKALAAGSHCTLEDALHLLTLPGTAGNS